MTNQSIPTCDVAIIGAGVFGSWTAYQLSQTGASVVLIDQYGPGNNRSSSGGDTRIMRMGYGPDEIYTRFAQRAFQLWQSVFQQTEATLFYNTGVLWLTRDDDKYSINTLATFKKLGVVFEKLTRAQLEHKYPQIEFGPVGWAIFEPESGALMAKRAVRSVVTLAEKKGVKYLNDSALPPVGHQKLEFITTVGGHKIQAKDFVFACGPWLPKIFPDLLAKRIHVTRQEVFYFGVPPGDLRFSPQAMPVWIDFNDLVYAVPDVEGSGFKVAIDSHGEEFDPDTGERTPSEEGLTAARDYLSLRVTALSQAPVLEIQVCQYENTSNGDFLIDKHPEFGNVWLVGGGSGHGFKHGPAVGEYVANRILTGGEVEPRFSLATKEMVHQRQVY